MPEVTAGEQEMERPTSEHLAEICAGVLSEEDCRDLAEMPDSDALNYVVVLLIGCDKVVDPWKFLEEKGITDASI
jgi:hypothetical protein